jgi:hypothetical protein
MQVELLRSSISYDDASGLMVWRSRTDVGRAWNARYPGRPVGSVGNHGYMSFMINGKRFLNHIAAWIIFYGEDPPTKIEHTNGVKTDNSINNLALSSERVVSFCDESDSDLVRRVLQYCPETGVFAWNYRKDKGWNWNRQWAGKIAGCLDGKGHWRIRINARHYAAHRIAWFLQTGQWPPNEIDHINNVKTDNRFCNLRLATRSQNATNMRPSSSNTSGFRGVVFDKSRNKWSARLTVNGKTRNIGRFDTKEDAVSARATAEDSLCGEFSYEKSQRMVDNLRSTCVDL